VPSGGKSASRPCAARGRPPSLRKKAGNRIRGSADLLADFFAHPALTAIEQFDLALQITNGVTVQWSFRSYRSLHLLVYCTS
jgi:hypothetical protein